MTSVIPQTHILSNPHADHLPHKNILKSKPTNQPTASKPHSKHRNSEEKQFRPIMRKSIEKQEVEESNLLAQKKGIKGEAEHQNQLRNIIQTHEEDYKQSKPFHKKYGTQNTTHTKNIASPQSRQEKPEAKAPQPVTAEGRNKTKQSFNKKLNSNIIKDEEKPSSKHSYRIKKVDTRSPKKIRDDLITINEEEHKLQMEILELHKSTKQQFQQYKATYKFTLDNLKKYFPQVQDIDQSTVDAFFQQVSDKIRLKKKELGKVESKLDANPYHIYLKNVPQDIMELHSSEEEDDEVPQLPDNRPRLENNIGSYASSMPGIKDKKYALNLRRTYDIFKEEEKQSRMVNHQPQGQDQRTKEEGQNKVTVNNKLKDFLLS